MAKDTIQDIFGGFGLDMEFRPILNKIQEAKAKEPFMQEKEFILVMKRF